MSGSVPTLRLLVLLLGLLISVAASAAANIEKLAKGNWLQLTTDDFDIITDLDEKKARLLMNDLEAFKYFQQKLIGVQLIPDLGPLRILALGSGSSFKRMDLPSTWAGVFVITEDRFYSITNVDNYSDSLKKPSFGRQVLLHEYTHFLSRFSLNRRSFPLWYEEGKAEYLGTFRFDGEKIYLGNPKAIMFRTSGLYSRTGSLDINVEEILTTKELPLRSEKMGDAAVIDRFYARSFFIMHYLNSAPALRQSLGLYLGALSAEKTEAEALKLAFNQTFEEFETSVKNYVTSGLMMRVISLTDGTITFPTPEIKLAKLDAEGFKAQIGYFISQ
ncbi:MAG: hypothetical protein K0Q78_571 [Cellvibrio sp.]|nr:hypothetical protein [Cellvibrio sp.]